MLIELTIPTDSRRVLLSNELGPGLDGFRTVEKRREPFESVIAETILEHRPGGKTSCPTSNVPTERKQKRSCCSQLLVFQNALANFINAGDGFDVIMSDLKSASEPTTYTNLLQSLEAVGVGTKEVKLKKWKESFLFERTVQVAVTESFSGEPKITSGCPRVAILGYLADVICTNQGRTQDTVSEWGGGDREKLSSRCRCLTVDEEKQLEVLLKGALFQTLFIDSICFANGFFPGPIHDRQYGSRENLGGDPPIVPPGYVPDTNLTPTKKNVFPEGVFYRI